MSYSVYVNDKYAGRVATNLGWSDFCDWADEISVGNFPEVVRLAEHGIVDEGAALRNQLSEAIKSKASKPKDRTVAATVSGLLKMLDGVAGDAVVIVTDGTGGSDGGEDAGEDADEGTDEDTGDAAD